MSTRPRYLDGDQLVDRGVDRGVLAADAQPGDEPEQPQEPHRRRETGDAAADQVDRQREDEQLLAAQSVGQPAEEQRADDLADEVDGAGEARPRPRSCGRCRRNRRPRRAGSPGRRGSRTLPGPTTTDQWNLVHGSRSIRAGTRLFTGDCLHSRRRCHVSSKAFGRPGLPLPADAFQAP